jgi:hypothetical protein
MPVPRNRPRPWPILLLLLALAILTGCEESADPSAQVKAPPAPKKMPPPAPKDEFIVGKRTQDIRRAGADVETKKGGRVASSKIVARDPITLPGNAYVTIIGSLAKGQIQHSLDLFHATNDRYPKDYDEFMQVIIKENNIALPQLPKYQSYVYDEKSHSLVIIEYPDLKENP